jgi:acyl carrier protein
MSSTGTDRAEIEELVHTLLVEELDVDPDAISSEATMDSLDIDSLDLVELGQLVERRYGVRIRASDAQGVEDLGGVVDMIHQRVVAGPDATPA